MPAVVRELPFAEKLQLVEALWDDLARSPERIPLSDSLKAELDRRQSQPLPRSSATRKFIRHLLER